MDAQLVPRSARPVATPRWIVRAIRRAPLVWYFGLAFALSWAWGILLALTGRTVSVGWRPTQLPGEFGPLLAAVMVTLATLGHQGLRDLLARMVRWRMAPRWWLATASPLLFFALAVPLVRLFGGDWPRLGDLDKFSGAPEIGVVGVWVILVLTTGFGEETGWRGYAIPQLQRTRRPLAASLILSVFWMLWHVPSFFVIKSYQDMGAAVYPGFFLGLVAGAVILTWLYNRSGSSILAVALWHGTYNLVSGTKAVEGGVAAVVSALVMAQAVGLVALEVRAQRRGRPSVLGPQATTDAPAGRSETRPRRPVGPALLNYTVNPVVRALLRSSLHGLLSRGVLLLTVRGRRSGQCYTLPVQYARRGDDVYILPVAPERKTWWRNLRGGAAVTLCIRGQAYVGDAEVLTGDAAAAAAATFVGTALERAARIGQAGVVVRIRHLQPLDGRAARAHPDDRVTAVARSMRG